jgi:hypothetical protein
MVYGSGTTRELHDFHPFITPAILHAPACSIYGSSPRAVSEEWFSGMERTTVIRIFTGRLCICYLPPDCGPADRPASS